MIAKRIIAAMAALLMLLSHVSSAYAADAASGGGAGTTGVDGSYLNINGCLFSYTDTDKRFPCRNYARGERKYVQLDPFGEAEGRSGFESSEISMKKGEVMRFEYWYSTEPNYDWFDFYATYGGYEHRESHLSGSIGGEENWFTYIFTAPADDVYSFKWEYKKDGSNNVGEDCVRISSIFVELHWDYLRAEAVTAPGTGVFEYDFSTGIYPFTATEGSGENHEKHLKSGSAGKPNSISSFRLFGDTHEGLLRFDYSVSCEKRGSSGSYYDYFEVLIDGESVLKDAGSDTIWRAFSRELSKGFHEIEFRYVKDGSVDEGLDCAFVDNVAFVNRSSEAETRWDDINRLASGEQGLYFNTPHGRSGWTTGAAISDASAVACSANRYLSGSSSVLETLVNMDAGETLAFDYLVSCGSGAGLTFSVNTRAVLTARGYSERGYKTEVFTAPKKGSYLFEWRYDSGSDIEGRDYACIKNVVYNGSFNKSIALDKALAVPDSLPISFETDTEYGRGFRAVYDKCAGSKTEFALLSGNRYMENTAATLTATTSELSGETLIGFSYRLSSEEGRDVLKFSIFKKGVECFSKTFRSNTEGSDWEYFMTQVDEPGAYTLVWEYDKDGSTDSGDDCAMLRDIQVMPFASPRSNGDVDGNGSVNTVDSDMALAHAIGVVFLNAAQIARGDLNMNGSISLDVAVAILRLAMKLLG